MRIRKLLVKMAVALSIAIGLPVGLSTPAFAFCEDNGGIQFAQAAGNVVSGVCKDGTTFYQVG